MVSLVSSSEERSDWWNKKSERCLNPYCIYACPLCGISLSGKCSAYPGPRREMRLVEMMCSIMIVNVCLLFATVVCQFDSNLSQVKSKQFSGKGMQFSNDEDVSVAMGQVRDELGNVMGEQAIRHGRSRNHFSRMIREKKQGEINMALHHKERILEDEDVAFDGNF